MKNKITIYLVDDHKVVTDGLLSVFQGEDNFEVLNTAQSGPQLLGQLVDQQPDVIVLDYSLNKSGDDGMNGLETAKRVMEEYPDIKLLMLSMHSAPDVIVPVVEAGVHGYMLKSERGFNMVEAVRRTVEEGSYFSPEIAPQLAMHVRQYRTNFIDITDREQEVLETLFLGNSAKEIGEILHISTKTVETHRKHLLEKFEAKNSIQLIHKALEKGYLNPPKTAGS